MSMPQYTHAYKYSKIQHCRNTLNSNGNSHNTTKYEAKSSFGKKVVHQQC